MAVKDVNGFDRNGLLASLLNSLLTLFQELYSHPRQQMGQGLQYTCWHTGLSWRSVSCCEDCVQAWCGGEYGEQEADGAQNPNVQFRIFRVVDSS